MHSGGRVAGSWDKESKLMPDVVFVLLTVALFAALALAVGAVERL